MQFIASKYQIWHGVLSSHSYVWQCQVIKGLDEGILSMKVGGLRRLYIPGQVSSLALSSLTKQCQERNKTKLAVVQENFTFSSNDHALCFFSLGYLDRIVMISHLLDLSS